MPSPQQCTATGTYSDASTVDITSQVAWSVSDSTVATVGANTGLVTIANAGQVWGGTIGLTATLAPGTPGTGSVIVVACDSGSVAPRMPQSTDQWVALGLSPWGTYFGLQEPSGSNAVGSGSFPLTLTPSTQAGAGIGPQMGQTEPAWLRNFCVMTGSAGMNYSWAAGATPQITSSIAFLLYGHIGLLAGAAGAYSPFLGVMRTNSTNLASIISDPVTANTGQVGIECNTQKKVLVGPLTHFISDRVHPYLLVVNTSSMNVLAATDVSVATSASSILMPFASDGNQKGFGGYNAGGRCVSGSYGYFAVCTGSVAESLSDPATAGAFLGKLGWNVHWASCPTDSGTIRLPFMPFHWTSLGLTPWTATWNMQEPAGNFFSNDRWDGKSWTGWNLHPSAMDAYRYNLSAGWTQGWARTGGMVTSAASHIVGIVNATNSPPTLFDPTGSFAQLGYVACLPPIAVRQVMGMGHVSNAAVIVNVQVNASGFPQVYCAGGTATGSHNVADSKVHPWLLVFDKTNSRVKVYTDLEAVTGTFNQTQIVANQSASIGYGGLTSVISTPPSGVYVYGAFCTGALAESLSTDGVASAFLKSMGWTVNW